MASLFLAVCLGDPDGLSRDRKWTGVYLQPPGMQRRLVQGGRGEAWGLLLVLRTKVADSTAALQKPLILILP